MYEATIKGKKVRLTNRDFESILKRFDVSRFKLTSEEDYCWNNMSCSLCKKHHSVKESCGACPFDVFRRGSLEQFFVQEGCMVLITDTTKGERALKLNPSSIKYRQDNKDRAITQLKRIHRKLKTKFKKV